MIALRITACRPTSTPCMRTDPSTSAHEWMRTSGDRIDLLTVEPEMMTPGDTMESSAWPALPSEPCTDLAGGHGSWSVKMGQDLL